MNTVLPLLAILLLNVVAAAQSMTGDITAVDGKNGTIIVTASGAPGRLYRTRPSVEVFINGAKSKIEDLAAGMTVKVTSGEPGLASRIDASGTPKSGTATGVQSLEQRLIGTKWLWWESKEAMQTIQFREGGRATWSLKDRGEFSWKVMPGENRIEGVSPHRGRKFKMTFNDSLTTAKIYEGDGRPRDSHIVTK